MATHADPRPQASKLTYEDYVTLPNDGRRYEILDGELAVSPSPRTLHQRVAARLHFAMEAWLRQNRLGEIFIAPCDVILDRTTVVVPDLVFVSQTRAAIVTERAIEGSPDLIIEILSDSTERHDRGAKLKLYAQYGVDRYWIIDADARVLEVYALRDSTYEQIGTYRDSDLVVCDTPAGLELRLAEIWPV
jgi:Uma2 family endonuclease